MFGILPESAIEEVLHNNIVGRLGCHFNDLTYVIPISYAYANNTLYFHTWPGMKMAIMRNNPAVCFQVDQQHDMANWESVIGWGTFQEIVDEKERAYALGQLQHRNLPLLSSETTHLTKLWPFDAGEASEIKGILFKIMLTSKTGRFEKYEYDAVQ